MSKMNPEEGNDVQDQVQQSGGVAVAEDGRSEVGAPPSTKEVTSTIQLQNVDTVKPGGTGAPKKFRASASKSTSGRPVTYKELQKRTKADALALEELRKKSVPLPMEFEKLTRKCGKLFNAQLVLYVHESRKQTTKE